MSSSKQVDYLAGYKKLTGQLQESKGSNPKGRPKVFLEEWGWILNKEFVVVKDGKKVVVSGFQVLREIASRESRGNKATKFSA